MNQGLRACWAKLSDRKKKEMIHFDRDAQQRDLMEALVQSFGYAPRCSPAPLRPTPYRKIERERARERERGVRRRGRKRAWAWEVRQ